MKKYPFKKKLVDNSKHMAKSEVTSLSFDAKMNILDEVEHEHYYYYYFVKVCPVFIHCSGQFISSLRIHLCFRHKAILYFSPDRFPLRFYSAQKRRKHEKYHYLLSEPKL